MCELPDNRKALLAKQWRFSELRNIIQRYKNVDKTNLAPTANIGYLHIYKDVVLYIQGKEKKNKKTIMHRNTAIVAMAFYQKR